MDIKNKIEIAKKYLSLHKNNNMHDWQPVGEDGEKKLIFIYDQLKSGEYGNVNESGKDENNIIYYFHEIGSKDSKTGNPIVFDWEEKNKSDQLLSKFDKSFLANQEKQKKEYTEAVTELSKLAVSDTGGGRVAAQVLLSAYNGSVWQLDVSDLCYLDHHNLKLAIAVMFGRANSMLEPHTVLEDGENIFNRIKSQWGHLSLLERAKSQMNDDF